MKTRLAPALGERRACELYRTLVACTLSAARGFGAHSEVEIEVRVAGSPDEAAARAWLGDDVTIRAQGEGDLGQRLDRAVGEAFTTGAKQVVVIGGDCPQLNVDHLSAAFAALDRHEAVLGPASDGGYYLLGLRRPLPELFRQIAWSTADVLAQTLAAARAARVEVARLETLHDLDVPEDLPFWAQTSTARDSGRDGVSVIIPTVNEDAWLPATLAAVLRDAPHEVIVVDGGSTDRTVEVARLHDVIALAGPAGRARQMNAGAAVATGEFLLFLHADTIPPAKYASLVRETLAGPQVVAGAFEFAISGEFFGRRFIERGTNWRARHRQMPYGDQGLFVHRDTFARAGGFPEQPIMEDYEFVRRLRRTGTIAIAPAPIATSGRRWQHLGPLRTTLINQFMIVGYLAGLSPVRLARWYHRGRQAPGDPSIAVSPVTNIPG